MPIPIIIREYHLTGKGIMMRPLNAFQKLSPYNRIKQTFITIEALLIGKKENLTWLSKTIKMLFREIQIILRPTTIVLSVGTN